MLERFSDEVMRQAALGVFGQPSDAVQRLDSAQGFFQFVWDNRWWIAAGSAAVVAIAIVLYRPPGKPK